MAFAFLLLTVAFETFGTACLQASHQFTRPWPSLGVVLGYALSSWFLAQALRTMPLGVAYATWSGLGIAIVTAIGAVVFGQRLTGPAIVGLALVAAGIATLHLSGSASHRGPP